MSVRERYKDTIDYSWVVTRQLDRIAEVSSRLHGRLPRAEYERRAAEYRAAVYTLYKILPPRARERLPNPRGYDLKSLDDWVAEAISVLDRLGLLMKKKVERYGGEYELQYIEDS